MTALSRVLGGLEAIRALKRSGAHPRRSIELVLLTSEEPTRFGIGCIGSRLISGTIDPAYADGLHGAQRGSRTMTLAQVRADAGFKGPLSSVRLQQDHYHAWVELHIEQGPLLEREEITIGIVIAIAAPASYRFTIEGVGGHAGALLMPYRRDALCAASEIILSLEKHALATKAIDTVATVGTCDVYPGAVNSVPSRVTLQVDIQRRRYRAPRSVSCSPIAATSKPSPPAARSASAKSLSTPMSPPPAHRTLSPSSTRFAAVTASRRSTWSAAPITTRLFMARISPIAMIFIPCRGGVSHRPDEYAAPADIASGARVLAATLGKLASE